MIKTWRKCILIYARMIIWNQSLIWRLCPPFYHLCTSKYIGNYKLHFENSRFETVVFEMGIGKAETLQKGIFQISHHPLFDNWFIHFEFF